MIDDNEIGARIPINPGEISLHPALLEHLFHLEAGRSSRKTQSQRFNAQFPQDPGGVGAFPSHTYYSFPGTELNSIEAQNYIKLMLEWMLPPIRFRRFGFTNLYLNWTRLSLFSSGIAEDIQKTAYRSTIANIGAQLDFKLVIFMPFIPAAWSKI